MPKILLCLVLVVCRPYIVVADVTRSDQYVCETYSDYYITKTLNPRCWYNPDVGDIPPNIIARHGYRVSEYKVETEDGYILGVIRVSNSDETKRNGVVFLQHAYTADCTIWIDKGRNYSLAFMLVDQGFEVWLGNSRGTRLSYTHKNLTTKENKYWNYSFHEIAIYDIPASLDVAKKVSGADKITYISHSGGSTVGLIYASLLKDHAKDTINLFITIAADSYITNFAIPAWRIYPLQRSLEVFRNTLVSIIGEENLQKIMTFTLHFIFRYNPLVLVYSLELFEHTPQQKYPPWLPLEAFQALQSANTKQFIHYLQMARAKNFQHFDYGPQKNKRLYGSKRPPEYPVSEIQVPFQIVYSPKDPFFNEKDAYLLYGKLKGVARNHKPHNAGDFNHYDFVYGKYCNKLYKWIIAKVMSTNNSNNRKKG